MSRRLFPCSRHRLVATGALAAVAGAQPRLRPAPSRLSRPSTCPRRLSQWSSRCRRGTNLAPVGNIALPICRVRGVIAPVNLLRSGCRRQTGTGNSRAVGNGGLAGSISFGDMRTAISRNYATASTDTGHSSNAPSDPWWTNAQQIKDYGYRSIHELTVKSKAIINAFYGTDPDRSYFFGCSTGGRQAFMEAQRYPDDYDGIIAGAPVYRVIELRARHVWTWQCNHADPTGERAIPVSKLPAIFKAVVAACDHWMASWTAKSMTRGVAASSPRLCSAPTPITTPASPHPRSKPSTVCMPGLQ